MVIRIGLSGVVALFLCSCAPADEEGGGAISVRAAAEDLARPIDAAMAPDGARIYFLQDAADGQGVFAIDGEAAPRQVAAGLDWSTRVHMRLTLAGTDRS